MTSEKFVKSKYPNARIERYKSGKIKGMQSIYYLTWSDFQSRNPKRLSEGDTKSQAWKNAKENIERYEAEVINKPVN